MDMQVQKAGDNSQQIQGGTIIINNGIDEKRSREIFSEMFVLERENYTKEALRIAEKRVEEFQDVLIPRIEEIEGAYAAFADPEFQFLLRDAQKSAAKTDRVADYDLLSELLLCHVQKNENKKNKAGIKRAVSIVNEIDNDALCGLTMMHAIKSFQPTSGSILDGLGSLDELYSKISYLELPNDMEWLEHLDTLGAIRLSTIAKMKKICRYMSESLNGYVCVGIEKHSEQYTKATEILSNVDLNKTILIEHELLDGYVRLPVVEKSSIKDISLKDKKRTPNENEIEAMNKVWELYSNDSSKLNEVKANFEEAWDSYSILKNVKTWWDSLDVAVSITHVGIALAHTNAKRCDSSIPDLI